MQRGMESSRPSFWITLVAVYVAGTISSLVWTVLGTALVLGGRGHFDATPSPELTVVLWFIGGAFATSFVAAFVVKAILNADLGQPPPFGTIVLGLFVGSLVGSVARLVLSGGTSVAGALLVRWAGYLVSVLIIRSARPAPPSGPDESEYKLPPGASWSEDSSLWVRSRR
jgi:hypothetical protein